MRKISSARARGDFLWHHVEPHLSLTGANADRRFVLRPGRERSLLSFLLREVLERKPPKTPLPGELLPPCPGATTSIASGETGIPPESLKEIADRLAAAKRPLVIAGGIGTASTGGLETASVPPRLSPWVTGAIPERVDFARSENYRPRGDAPGHGGTLRPDGKRGSRGRVPLPDQSRLLPAPAPRLQGKT